MITNDKVKYHLFEKENNVPLHLQTNFLDSLDKISWEAMVYESEGQILAAFVYYRKQKSIFKYITHPDLCKWMGPIFSEQLQATQKQEIFTSFVEELPAHAYYEQNFDYAITSSNIPTGFTPHVSEQYSYVLNNLQDLDKTYKSICSDYRNNKFPKAEKSIRIESREDLKSFYDLHAKSFYRQNIVVPYGSEYFSFHANKLISAGQAKLFFAEDLKGKLCSVAMLCWDKETAYYHIAGDDPELRKTGSGVYLAWHLIQYTSNILGLDKFDFEGSMISGIERVRKNFGAEKRNYIKIKKYNSLLFKSLSKLKSFN